MGDRPIILLDEGWAKMQAGVDRLIGWLEGEPMDKVFSPEKYMEIYTTIYNMITQKAPHDYAEQLYVKYKNAFDVYIDDKVVPALLEARDGALLPELSKRWANHQLLTRWLSRFFNYLERFYIQRHTLHPLVECGHIRFKDLVYMRIRSKAKDAVLKLVEREREGELVDRALIKSILAIFIEVGACGVGLSHQDPAQPLRAYGADFEAPLLVDTAAYYRRRAAEWMEQDACPDYMVKAEECLQAEEERAAHYLHETTKSKLLEVVEAEVLAQHQAALLQKEHSGCAALLRDGKTADLGRMFRLFQRIPQGLRMVADMFKAHVEAEGMALVRQATAAADAKKAKDAGAQGAAAKATGGATHEQLFIRQVIDLHDKYTLYVTTCFLNSSAFHHALKEAFEAFCNRPVAGSSAAELLASFCDTLLKKGSGEKLSDEAIEESLDKVIHLLPFISEKDMFAEFYRKKLSRRLLGERSASDELERAMLSRLKLLFGMTFTYHMEGMVRDLQLAKEKQQLFERYLERHPLSLELEVTVLTVGNWPTHKAVDLLLPREMAEGLEAFTRHFGATADKKLAWIYSQGTCQVRGNFDAGPIDFILSGALQAALLVLFNDVDELTFTEIQVRLRLPDDEVIRVLHSLSCAKHSILTKEPAAPRIVSKTDRFRFNPGFKDARRRIRVPLPPLDERQVVLEDVSKARSLLMDAAIVRIMKSRKELEHRQLVVEVVQQLIKRFTPDLRRIKARIEIMIEKEFLERVEFEPTKLRYLA